jgi:hypothetical protein
MSQGYKVTTFTVSAHTGLQKNLSVARQEKDTVRRRDLLGGD